MNEASRWRVELARELAAPYCEKEGVGMVCLGGSAARGISDDYSDLDIIVYWDRMDEEWIKEGPLESSLGIRRTALMSMHPGTFIESYHLNGLKVDFGHSTLDQWAEWVNPLIDEFCDDPGLLGMVGGFLESIPFCGEPIFEEWRAKLERYPDELARKVIGRSMGIYVKGYLVHQCLERGDELAWYDGLVSMLKKLLDITAAVNGVYYSAAEPRWVEHYLGRMPLKARELSIENIRRMLSEPGTGSEELLYRILDDTLGVVAERFPEFAEKIVAKRERLESMRVRSCGSRPEVP